MPSPPTSSRDRPTAQERESLLPMRCAHSSAPHFHSTDDTLSLVRSASASGSSSGSTATGPFADDNGSSSSSNEPSGVGTTGGNQLEDTDHAINASGSPRWTDGNAPPNSNNNNNSNSKSIMHSVCWYILITEFCERLAYYGLTGSLPIFFHKHLGMTSVLATEMNSVFSSLCYLTPLLGAYMADKHLGRFRTIVVFCLIYLVGLLFCVVGAFPGMDSSWLFLLGLFGGVAFGAGGIKPNVVVLGADQFDVSDPQQRIEKDSFFNWFYWAINTGATISYAVLANLAVNGFPPYIKAEYGFFASFLIPFACFVVAFGVFYCGKSRYRQVPPQSSALSVFCGIVLQAGQQSSQGKLVLSGIAAFVPGIVLTTISYFIDPQQVAWHLTVAVAGALCVAYGTIVLICSGRCTRWLYRATVANGGTFVNSQVKDVAQVMRLMPYMSFIIVFWTVYGQQNANFLLQGCQMDLRVSNSNDQSSMISSATLVVLDSLVILVCIPLFDRVVYPLITSCGIQLTLLRKIGAGLVCAVLAMVAAGWLEQQRKSRGLVTHAVSNCSDNNESLPMSLISVWWQTPQYLLIGISEILTSISAYDLFYSEVPESMRSVCQAINLLTTTLGYIVAGGINSILSSWIPSNLNDGKLEGVFYVVGALALVNALAFMYIAQGFVYHAPQQTPPTKRSKDAISGFSPALPRAVHRFIGKMKLRRRDTNPMV